MTLIVLALLLIQQTAAWFLTWMDPPTIYAVRTSSAIAIDGVVDERTWESTHWSSPFVDITGDQGRLPVFETRTALAWNDTALFIAARIEEPHVWATLTERDAVIYRDNDFEFFFDPDGDNHRYGEIEINALNTVWDLLLERPYRDRGPARTDWNMPGMLHAVHIDGTLNDPSDIDRGWTLEICIPWRDIADLSVFPLPPNEGRQWRVNFSRVEWAVRDSGGAYKKLPGRENNWVWSPIGIVNMHIPERWGIVEFTSASTVTGTPAIPEEESVRRFLMEVYYLQKRFKKKNGTFASSGDDLGLPAATPGGFVLSMGLTASGYEATLEGTLRSGDWIFSVDQAGKLGAQRHD